MSYYSFLENAKPTSDDNAYSRGNELAAENVPDVTHSVDGSNTIQDLNLSQTYLLQHNPSNSVIEDNTNDISHVPVDSTSEGGFCDLNHAYVNHENIDDSSLNQLAFENSVNVTNLSFESSYRDLGMSKTILLQHNPSKQTPEYGYYDLSQSSIDPTVVDDAYSHSNQLAAENFHDITLQSYDVNYAIPNPCVPEITSRQYDSTYGSNENNTCDICHLFFETKCHFDMHMRSHSGEGREICNNCGKEFPEEYLTAPMNEKPHLCSLCKVELVEKSVLDVDKRNRKNERPHKCPFCEKAFTQKSYLKKHMLTHTKQRPHTCPYCEKTFTQKSHLNDHVLIHTKERPHMCPYCEKRFSQKSTLNYHILTHTKERPHRCPLCEKTFTLKSNLKVHIMTHTKERPHKCSFCEKAFTQKIALNRHMSVHAKENVLES